MIARRHLVYFCSFPLLLLACCLIAVVPVDRGGSVIEHLCIGCSIGTMFGVTTIAAAWVALGPGWLAVRLPLSMLMVAAQLAALQTSTWLWHEPGELVELMAVALASQWLSLQLPLAGMALGFGLSLRHCDEPPGALARRQFGIRQLMIFTTIIAALLGIGRIVITNVSFNILNDSEMPIFLFLVGSAVIMTLPLVFASFLARRAWQATLATIAFIPAVTLIESPLLNAATTRAGPDIWHLIWINGFTTFWVLALVGVIRACGYHFRHAAATDLQAAAVQPGA
jgi:hypothetical protein